jgi:hypothetical protein
LIHDPEAFRTGRDLAAWIGITPRANSSGGKERLGKIAKRELRDDPANGHRIYDSMRKLAPDFMVSGPAFTPNLQSTLEAPEPGTQQTPQTKRGTFHGCLKIHACQNPVRTEFFKIAVLNGHYNS